MIIGLIRGIIKSIWKIIFSFLGLFVAIGIFTWWANHKVSTSAEPYLYNTVDSIPYTRVGLIPGTAPTLADGQVNLYFRYRIEAAVKLWKAKKIRIIIVSGDNSTEEYNEPKAMKAALIKRGIPAKNIVLDYAGFRTFDTIIRCRDVFGQRRVVFISQQFHNERALYIGRHNKLDIIALNAKDPPDDYSSITQSREWFARVKMMLDIHVLDTEPHFLGEKITLPR